MVERILAIGSDPADSPEVRRRKRLLVIFALAVVVPDPVWAWIYFANHEAAAAVVPMLYIPLSLANLAAFSRTRRLDWAVAGQSLIILVLPFLVHAALGGFQASSGVVLWSVLAAFSGLVFGGIRPGAFWLVAFGGIVLLAAFVQPRPTNNLPETVVTGFFIANIVTIAGVAFGLIAAFARQLAAERTRSERLLLNVLPAVIAERLRERDEVIADAYDAATVVFADVVNSTRLTVELTPSQMVSLLDEHVAAFDALADRYGVEKIRTIGDNWMGVAGVPQPRDDHAAAAARFALGVLGFIEDRRHAGGRCLDFRVGLSSGPMIGGVIGRRKFVFDVWGDAVNTAARMESTGEAGRIQISEPTYRLLRDAFVCEPRGSMEVKGKGQMMTWWLIREGVSQLAHSAD